MYTRSRDLFKVLLIITSIFSVSSYSVYAGDSSLRENPSITELKNWRSQLDALNFPTVIKVKPSFWKEARREVKPFPKISRNSEKKRHTIAIYKLHFMQRTASNMFHNRHKTVLMTAMMLRLDPTIIQGIPKLHIWKDNKGTIWTLDHRRLISYILSYNTKCVPIIWAKRAEIINDKFKFSNRDHGKSIYLKLDKQHVLIVHKPSIPTEPYTCP